ncbi:MAG: hypothetical protein E7207_03375 [Clostridium butyricum]|nr:hypothetical protein [Clostridium butyricum]
MEQYVIFFILFVIYSFLGWVLETLHASIRDKKFVNRGFLVGCFCPIYGFGGVITVWIFQWINIYIKNNTVFTIVSVLATIVIVTLLEYITGYILEKIFNCKWWDYSEDFGNINGYICLSYSLLWGVLAFVLIKVINPIIMNLVGMINVRARVWIAAVFFVYFIIDFVKTIIDTLGLRNVIINYSKFSVADYYKKIKHYKRLLKAFPRLMLLNVEVKNREIKKILSGELDKIKEKIK